MVFKQEADVIWLRSTTSHIQHIPFSVMQRCVRAPLSLLSLSVFCSHCPQTLSRLLPGFSPSLYLRSWSLCSPLLSLCFLPLLFLFLSDSVPQAEIESVTHSSSYTKSPGKTFFVIYSLCTDGLKTENINPYCWLLISMCKDWFPYIFSLLWFVVMDLK